MKTDTSNTDHGEQSYHGTGKLKGRKALITGGDSEIGKAAVIAFAREGADVVINYRAEEEADAQEMVHLLANEGHKIVALPGDVQEESFCKKLVDDAISEMGGLDILVNNAGKQQLVDPILDSPSEQLTDVEAMVWITKAALPHMRAGATIVNTNCVPAHDSSPTTKGPIVCFTMNLAHQLANKEIRVNAIAPGPLCEETETDHPSQPVELAPLYVLLASTASSYATGQVYGACDVGW